MDLKDIENLAELAKIELLDIEKSKLLEDLGSILAYVKQIEELDVPDLEIEYSQRNVWREDEDSFPIFSKDLIISQFPDSKNNFLKVKKIL